MKSTRAIWAVSLLVLGGVAEMAHGQSLWQASRSPMRNLMADNVAHEIGDLITIVIRERQQIQDDEEVDTERDTQEDFSVDALDALPNAFNPLPNVRYGSSRTFEGSTEFARIGVFESQISATVIDVQPNGNLVIEGKRIIRLSDDTRTIRVTGLIRPFDLRGDNTVLSESIANAEISYESNGPMKQGQERGWFTKVLDFLWPF